MSKVFCLLKDFALFLALMFHATLKFRKKANGKKNLCSRTPPDLEHSIPNYLTDWCFTISKVFKML